MTDRQLITEDPCQKVEDQESHFSAVLLTSEESGEILGAVLRPTKNFPGLSKDFDLSLRLRFFSSETYCNANWVSEDETGLGKVEAPLLDGPMTRAQCILFAKHIIFLALTIGDFPFIMTAFELFDRVAANQSSKANANVEIEEFRLQMLWRVLSGDSSADSRKDFDSLIRKHRSSACAGKGTPVDIKKAVELAEKEAIERAKKSLSGFDFLFSIKCRIADHCLKACLHLLEDVTQSSDPARIPSERLHSVFGRVRVLDFIGRDFHPLHSFWEGESIEAVLFRNAKQWQAERPTWEFLDHLLSTMSESSVFNWHYGLSCSWLVACSVYFFAVLLLAFWNFVWSGFKLNPWGRGTFIFTYFALNPVLSLEAALKLSPPVAEWLQASPWCSWLRTGFARALLVYARLLYSSFFRSEMLLWEAVTIGLMLIDIHFGSRLLEPIYAPFAACRESFFSTRAARLQTFGDSVRRCDHCKKVSGKAGR
uniref:Uncharacterized protein n=1 Tax=Chromera velia CCMP2878 TaxID=1169474 RepID=A0A0G4IB25_9ALVE|eukprot:Cvel_12619.t1-p1 / transcript=Cvel_12619.t1 / gene=Cvel_12619 / organism=Chromera_velia_CCMP2878 / gene_product=hypothetical protein / transcript_product=hypothetical protein / location=Cvel_scaffold833:4573-6131(+) / protein_length=480 / sequence_SO=supercontig / SO=protein_coding / is_pseudo=false